MEQAIQENNYELFNQHYQAELVHRLPSYHLIGRLGFDLYARRICMSRLESRSDIQAVACMYGNYPLVCWIRNLGVSFGPAELEIVIAGELYGNYRNYRQLLFDWGLTQISDDQLPQIARSVVWYRWGYALCRLQALGLLVPDHIGQVETRDRKLLINPNKDDGERLLNNMLALGPDRSRVTDPLVDWVPWSPDWYQEYHDGNCSSWLWSSLSEDLIKTIAHTLHRYPSQPWLDVWAGKHATSWTQLVVNCCKQWMVRCDWSDLADLTLDTHDQWVAVIVTYPAEQLDQCPYQQLYQWFLRHHRRLKMFLVCQDPVLPEWLTSDSSVRSFTIDLPSNQLMIDELLFLVV